LVLIVEPPRDPSSPIGAGPPPWLEAAPDLESLLQETAAYKAAKTPMTNALLRCILLASGVFQPSGHPRTGLWCRAQGTQILRFAEPPPEERQPKYGLPVKYWQ
jgi:hypothetical protein